jgi:hypothetical protein
MPSSSQHDDAHDHAGAASSSTTQQASFPYFFTGGEK